MKRIIIVDDNTAIQRALKIAFDSSRYHVSFYDSGLPILNNEFDIPDLIILDRYLLGVDGLDICRFLKSQDATKNVPVIIVSATPKIHKLAIAAGADDVLEKPFNLFDLRKVIARLIS